MDVKRAHRFALLISLLGTALICVSVLTCVGALMLGLQPQVPLSSNRLASSSRTTPTTTMCIGTRTGPVPAVGIGWYPQNVAYFNPPPFYWDPARSQIACTRMEPLPMLPPFAKLTIPWWN